MNRAPRFALGLAALTTPMPFAACGGGGTEPVSAAPAVAVSITPTTATVQAGGPVKLAATVSNDRGNSGVNWTVSCSAAQCGVVSPATTVSGASTTYTAPSTFPAGNAPITVTVTATSVADASKSASATLIPVGHIPGYEVGVDYHSYGSDFASTSFITIYNQPQVRLNVQTQLQGIADRGASFVHTRTGPRNPDLALRILSGQLATEVAIRSSGEPWQLQALNAIRRAKGLQAGE